MNQKTANIATKIKKEKGYYSFWERQPPNDEKISLLCRYMDTIYEIIGTVINGVRGERECECDRDLFIRSQILA